MQNPSPGAILTLEQLRAAMAGATVAFRHPHLDPDAPEILADTDRLARAFGEADRAVQGNRNPKSPITWSDLRRLFARTLEVCLEHLESEG